MEGIAVVRVSDLTELFNQLSALQVEIQKLKESEDDAKAYSIQQTADLLNLHYCSVRKLVIKGKIFAKYLEGDRGKCVIPLWAIKEYLRFKKDLNY
jgi:hypothetical protein